MSALMAKRLFDLVMSAAGLLLLGPVFLLIALSISLETPGPVFFRQERVGRFGRVFRIHKFRTMVADAEHRGPHITAGADARITRVGGLLRRYKLDELAQLVDVFLGDMSLVGPRPEVPAYIAYYPADARNIVLSVRPGITDWASIRFKNENEILGNARDPHLAYVHEILPVKIRYYTEYVSNRTFWGDVRIILATIAGVLR